MQNTLYLVSTDKKRPFRGFTKVSIIDTEKIRLGGGHNSTMLEFHVPAKDTIEAVTKAKEYLSELWSA